MKPENQIGKLSGIVVLRRTFPRVVHIGVFFHSVCELWCGESNGSISIFTMHENSVVGHDIINHFEAPLPNVEVLQLVSSHSPIQYHSRHPAVWSYIYPGPYSEMCTICV